MENIRSNKRRSQRVAASLPVTWVRRGVRTGCFTSDIGADGMFLRTDEETEVSNLMQLEVHLPGESPLLMFVSARFVGKTDRGKGIGVQIYVVSDQDRKRWHRFYRSQVAVANESTHLLAQVG
jgi:hypothetical protein